MGARRTNSQSESKAPWAVRGGGVRVSPRSERSRKPSQHPLLQLQAAVGNRALTGLLGRPADGKSIDSVSAINLDPGRELAADDRAWLEKAAGPLPAISLHDGAEASRFVAGAGAEAAAAGSKVVLPNRGQSGLSRRRLLAHEVAHVLQQRAAHLPRGDVNT